MLLVAAWSLLLVQALQRERSRSGRTKPGKRTTSKKQKDLSKAAEVHSHRQIGLVLRVPGFSVTARTGPERRQLQTSAHTVWANA
jgi:hypothetical protein